MNTQGNNSSMANAEWCFQYFRNHFHYKYDRVPTIRENARLQSFTDKFEFLGSKTEQNRQVGNAVPVLLAEALARQIKSALKE